MGQNEDIAAGVLARLLAAAKISCDHVGNRMKLVHASPVTITVGEIEVIDITSATVVHANIGFRFNPEMEESSISTCSTGFGADLSESIQDAMAAWFTADAPPLFSVLSCEAVLDAEWLPDGESLGVPGGTRSQALTSFAATEILSH